MSLKEMPVVDAILGIDLGSYRTGLALLEIAKPARLLQKGRIVAASDRYVERWDTTISQIEKFMLEFVMGRPVVVAVEQPIVRNAETTRLLTGCFGAVMWWLHTQDITAIDVNLSHAKKVFCGKNLKGKQPTIDRANQLYGLSFKYNSKWQNSDDDVADAIQVAYCLREDLIQTDDWFRERSQKDS